MKSAKKSLDEKDILLNKYKSTTHNFRSIFICIFKKLTQFSQVLSLSNSKSVIPNDLQNEIISLSQISKDSEGILEMLNKFPEEFDSTGSQQEVLNSLTGFMESIENKITILITNLLNTKVKKNEIKLILDGVINEENVEFFNKEIIEENKSLRILLDKNAYLLENIIKNPDLNLFEEMKILTKKQNEEILALNKQLEEMKVSTKTIRQKLASSPYLPFIIVKDIDTVKIKQHNCLCFYCGFDIIKEKENEGNFNGSKSSINLGINTSNNTTQIINGINNNPQLQSHSHNLNNSCSINPNFNCSNNHLQENKAFTGNSNNEENNSNSHFHTHDIDMVDSSNINNSNNTNNLNDINANKNACGK